MLRELKSEQSYIFISGETETEKIFVNNKVSIFKQNKDVKIIVTDPKDIIDGFTIEIPIGISLDNVINSLNGLGISNNFLKVY